jgi:hypothetical protein
MQANRNASNNGDRMGEKALFWAIYLHTVGVYVHWFRAHFEVGSDMSFWIIGEVIM